MVILLLYLLRIVAVFTSKGYAEEMLQSSGPDIADRLFLNQQNILAEYGDFFNKITS